MSEQGAFYKDVGRLIREARDKRKLSQAHLAAAVGLTRTSISNIEKGRQKLLLHTFYEIAATLGIEPAELLPREQLIPEPDLKGKLLRELPEEERAFVESGIGVKKSGG